MGPSSYPLRLYERRTSHVRELSVVAGQPALHTGLMARDTGATTFVKKLSDSLQGRESVCDSRSATEHVQQRGAVMVKQVAAILLTLGVVGGVSAHERDYLLA